MKSNTFAALRHRNFRLMWISLLVSNSGTWLQTVAQDYLVFELTGRAEELGEVNLVRAVALISLSFVGGTIADRLDKRKLLMVTQTAFAGLAILLGVLVQTDLIQVWHVMAVSFVGSVLLALDQPARQALLPYLVPREDLMNAVALNSVTFTGAAAIGPALAGPVVGLLGIAWGFHLNAFSFLAVIGAVYALRLPPHVPRQQAESVRSAAWSGIQYIAASPAILLGVSLLTVFSFFAVPYQSVLPVFSEAYFDGDVGTLGWLRSAPGIGSLVGGFLLARFSGYPRKDWLIMGGAMGFSAFLIGFSAARSLPVALLYLLIANLAFTVFQSTVQTVMQTLTEDRMRGRVMSLFAVSVIGMWPLGAYPISLLTDRAGPAVATAAGAVAAGLFAVGTAVLARRTVARFQV